MAPETQKQQQEEVFDYVHLKALPSFSKLQHQVQAVAKSSSWWDLYGVDWFHVFGAFATVPVGLKCITSSSYLMQATGIVLLGGVHGLLANKSGHLAAHGGFGDTTSWILMRLFIDFIGGFSAKVGSDIHIKVHHPHTNIIGLGDSSTWRMPFLPRITYMFLAPLTLPILTPLVAFVEITRSRDWREMINFICLVGSGLIFHSWLLIHYSGCCMLGSLVYLYIIRAVVAIPYIHINIFQHIGLPMYSQKNRPARIYQMSTGCLNLSSNFFLNITFGHSLVNCHVEHHLFPKLSDNMCLKIKPIVQRYLQDNHLPYHEESYFNRMIIFLRDYEKLMVNAPPITHFVGIQ